MSTSSAPDPQREYELGRSYGKALRQVSDTGARARQALLMDLIGDDRTLLAPLRHLVESPSFLEVISEVSSAVRLARSDALLQELRAWCNRETLIRLEAFLSGALQIPFVDHAHKGSDLESRKADAENASGSMNQQSPPGPRESAPSSKSSAASSASVKGDGRSPDESIPYLREKAYAASLIGDHESAIRSLTQALRIDPANASLYMQRASLHAKNQEAVSAVHDFTSVLRLEPNNHEARAQRGQAYALMGAMDKAVDDWEHAASSGHYQASQWLFSRLMEDGNRFILARQYHESLRVLNYAIKLVPGSAEAYLMRGKVNQAIPEHGLAISDFSSAIRLDPANASAYALRGKSYECQGKMRSALRDWQRAAELGSQEAAQWLSEARASSPVAPNQPGSHGEGETADNAPFKKQEASPGLSALLGFVVAASLCVGLGWLGYSLVGWVPPWLAPSEKPDRIQGPSQ